MRAIPAKEVFFPAEVEFPFSIAMERAISEAKALERPAEAPEPRAPLPWDVPGEGGGLGECLRAPTEPRRFQITMERIAKRERQMDVGLANHWNATPGTRLPAAIASGLVWKPTVYWVIRTVEIV